MHFNVFRSQQARVRSQQNMARLRETPALYQQYLIKKRDEKRRRRAAERPGKKKKIDVKDTEEMLPKRNLRNRTRKQTLGNVSLLLVRS